MEKNKVAFISDLMLAAVALIWGLGFPVTQMAIDAQLSSGLIVALRFLIAAAVMGIIFRREVRTITPRDACWACSRADPGHGVPAAGHGAEHDHPFQFGLPHIAQCHYCAVSELGLLPSASPPAKCCWWPWGAWWAPLVLTLSPGEGLQLGFGDLLVLCCAVAFSLHISYLAGLPDASR